MFNSLPLTKASRLIHRLSETWVPQNLRPQGVASCGKGAAHSASDTVDGSEIPANQLIW